MDADDLYRLVFETIPVVESNDDTDFSTHAIGIFLGGGSYEACNPRLSEVSWRTLTHKVWVAGTRNDPYYNVTQACDLLGGTPTSLRWQGCRASLSTPDQTWWFNEQLCADTEVTTFIVSTSRYHLPRCVLTFMKDWFYFGDRRKLQLRLLPTSDPIPAETTSTNQTIEGEIERIKRYQGTGDVASKHEFELFLSQNM